MLDEVEYQIQMYFTQSQGMFVDVQSFIWCYLCDHMHQRPGIDQILPSVHSWTCLLLGSKHNDWVSRNLNICPTTFSRFSCPPKKRIHTIFRNKQMEIKTAGFRKCAFWASLSTNLWFGGHFDIEWPLTTLQYKPTKSNIHRVRDLFLFCNLIPYLIYKPYHDKIYSLIYVSRSPPPHYFDHFWSYVQMKVYAHNDHRCHLRVRHCTSCLS